MKVFIVYHSQIDYDWNCFGVFSTREKANAFIATQDKGWNLEIEEREIDRGGCEW